MFFVYYLLIVLFAILIIRSNGVDRLVYYYAAIFLIPANVHLFPVFRFLVGHALFITCFFLSLYRNKEFPEIGMKRSPLYFTLLLMFFSYLLIGIMDSRISFANGLYRGVYQYFESYFAFFVGWCGAYCITDADKNILIRKFLRISFIFTLYGVFIFYLRQNPIMEALRTHEAMFEHIAGESFRSFRVNSFTQSCSVYGYVTGLFAFVSIVWLQNKSKTDKLAILLLIINCILSATRAAIFPVVVLFAIYWLFTLTTQYQKFLKILCCVFLSVFILNVFVPETVSRAIGEYGEMFTSVFDENSQSEVGGSSKELRDRQMATAMMYLKHKPWFGHGFSYYQEEILNVSGRDENLSGMESYVCFLGVEYGALNICIVLLFYVQLLLYFYDYRKVEREKSIASVSILLSYVLFLCYAWIGGNWVFVMPLLGGICREMYNKISYEKQGLIFSW